MAETCEDHGIGEATDAAAQFPGQELLERLSKRQGHWSGKGQCALFKAKPKVKDPKVSDLLKKLEEKGAGTFGKVSKSKLCVDGRDDVVATKEIGYCSKDIIDKEIDILKNLRHRHLVTFIGSYTISTSTTIIIYPCASCDLKELLETLDKAQHDGLKNEATNQLKKLGWAAADDWKPAEIHSQLRRICGCIASGLLYLEQKKIRHKDIKPSNILIDRGAAYITDFNVSGNYHGKDSTRTCGPFTGTQWYSAPESLLGEERGSPADVYSLGLVFLEIFAYITGHSLGRMKADYTIDSGRASEGVPSKEQVQRNANLKIMLVTLSFHDSGKENHAMRDLILGMISKTERDRPHAFEVMTELWAMSPDGQFFCPSCHEHKDCFGYKGLLKRHKLLQDKYKRLQGEIRQQELVAASHTSNVPQLQVQTTSLSTRQSSRSPSSARRTPSINDIASLPPPPPPTRQSRPKAPIARNKQGDRLDLSALNFARNLRGLGEADIDRLHELQAMGLCREHYLKKNCRNRARCDYQHDEALDDGDLEKLDYLVRASSPCVKGKRCTAPVCMYGHLCPQGPSKETHGCSFDADMHQLDTVPVLDTDMHD